MMRYVAFFRGINVGKHNPVKMAELEQLLTGLGYREVWTYLRSGNAVFNTDMDEAALCAELPEAFFRRFGFESAIAVRSAQEMRAVVTGLSFTAGEIAQVEANDPEVEHLYVYFLDKSPEPEQVLALIAQREPGDEVQVGARELYVLCQRSIRLSKTVTRMTKTFPGATARNWHTVLKVDEMLRNG